MEVFRTCDASGDGFLSLEDLTTCCQTLVPGLTAKVRAQDAGWRRSPALVHGRSTNLANCAALPLPTQEVASLMVATDVAGDGCLNYKDFINRWAHLRRHGTTGPHLSNL